MHRILLEGMAGVLVAGKIVSTANNLTVVIDGNCLTISAAEGAEVDNLAICKNGAAQNQ